MLRFSTSTPEHKVTASEILRMIIDTDKMAFEMGHEKTSKRALHTPRGTPRVAHHLKLAQIINHERKTLTTLGKIDNVKLPGLLKAKRYSVG